MGLRRRSKGHRKRGDVLAHVVGSAGLACMVLAILGLVLGQNSGRTATPPHSEEAIAVAASAPPAVQVTRPAVTTVYYPLEVGLSRRR